MTTVRRIAVGLVVACTAAVLLTCSDTTGPEPATFLKISGDNQNALVNHALSDSLVVQVKDAQGQPMKGVTVTWSVTGGGGVSQAVITSGADGRASVERVLGPQAGPQATMAKVDGLDSLVFSAMAEAGPVPQLVLATPPSSTALSGVVLNQQPIVIVEDGNGEPLGGGIAVTASLLGGGTLAGTTTVSSDGYGEVHYTDLALSGPDGSYILAFTAQNMVGVQSGTITLSSGSGQSGQLVIKTQPPGAAQGGVALQPQPVIQAQDGSGHALGVGIQITAGVSAGGLLTGALTVPTDASGEAHFADLALGGPDGTYTLTFTAPNLAAAESNPIMLATTANEAGAWSQPFSWPIVAIHSVLLPDGRVLTMGRTGSPTIWDPATGNFKSVPAPANLFCAGHALLADGRVLVAGGHIKDGFGLPNITLFSHTNDSWTSSTPMARGRWYPTATVMGNGDVVITAGTDQDSAVVTLPEVWSNGSVRQLTGAAKSLPWYPRAWVTADGKLFVAGPGQQTFFLSTDGNGSWTKGPLRLFGGRNYGAAAMYDDGKVLYAGGAMTTNTAEIIDLNQASPGWSWTSAMHFARRHHNLTVLPTGQVLATGGVGGTTFDDVSKGVHAAEVWDPETGNWTTLASNQITRGYHGTSLLLPDGRILNAGSGQGAGAPDEFNAELFTPPYLLRGPRPTITDAPAEVNYGQQFRVLTPDAAAITHVSLIRLGAVTHAFDENQRFQRLSFTADATGLTVTAPSSSNRTPPGHYMLFILNGNDVPSVAKIIGID